MRKTINFSAMKLMVLAILPVLTSCVGYSMNRVIPGPGKSIYLQTTRVSGFSQPQQKILICDVDGNNLNCNKAAKVNVNNKEKYQ